MHAESFQASLPHEPWAVTTKQGGPFKVGIHWQLGEQWHWMPTAPSLVEAGHH